MTQEVLFTLNVQREWECTAYAVESNVSGANIIGGTTFGPAAFDTEAVIDIAKAVEISG